MSESLNDPAQSTAGPQSLSVLVAESKIESPSPAVLPETASTMNRRPPGSPGRGSGHVPPAHEHMPPYFPQGSGGRPPAPGPHGHPHQHPQHQNPFGFPPHHVPFDGPGPQGMNNAGSFYGGPRPGPGHHAHPGPFPPPGPYGPGPGFGPRGGSRGPHFPNDPRQPGNFAPHPHDNGGQRYSPSHPTALDGPPHPRNGPPANFQQHGGGPGPGGAQQFNRHGPGGPPHGSSGPGGPPAVATRTPPPPTATFDYHPTHWVTFQAPSDVISSMPPYSRLFLGNLASERTDRAELARIFAPYGNIAEIVLKGSFGFVQFDSPEACTRATSESGRKLAGLSMDVKVSREKNATRREAVRGGPANRRRGTTDHAGPTRRSPPRGRANDRDRPRGNRNRSSSYSSTSSRGSDRHGHRRDSPRRRRRSASVSPDRKASKWGPPDVGRREVVLPTPTMSAPPVATGVFSLASRTGSAVPECQIIVLSDMDRNYIGQVEAIIRNAGIKADVINMNAGMSVHDIVYQMMAEGCRGVLFLERKHAVSKTCSLQIFQVGNTVAEYENVNPEIAALLLIRDRSVRPVIQPALPAGPQNNIASVLATLLGQQAQPQAAAAGAAGGGMDAQMLVTLMATLQQQQQQQQQQLAQLSQSLGAQTGGPGGGNPLAALAGLGGLAGLVQQQQPQSQAIAAQPPHQQQQNLAGLLSLLAGQGGGAASQQQNLAQQQQQQRQQTQSQQFLRSNMAASPMQSPVTPVAGANGGAFPQTGAGSGGNPSAMAGQQQQQQQPQTQVAELLNRLKSLQQLHPGAGAGGAARS
ncbi:hypothetical protein HDU87_004702 [Geranomyces variabilis]|uniref:RRM domain-containing protein n=1 Tax=Geranomyces variabilis TaxID=109894 RepID=A0AAD5XM91_9FUNG|nr:hypothetical protein HDU87_004702 [Geranomyces variabilis]